jgi:hypothetical protein
MLFIAMVLASCEKVVALRYKDNQSRIVIEGNITDQKSPYFVKVIKSIRLPSTGSYPTIDNATVTLNDDKGNSEDLTPMGNGLYRSNKIDGHPGNTYNLTLNAEGQVYTAQSSMPQKVPFDSIEIEEVMVTGETEFNVIPNIWIPSAMTIIIDSYF